MAIERPDDKEKKGRSDINGLINAAVSYHILNSIEKGLLKTPGIDQAKTDYLFSHLVKSGVLISGSTLESLPPKEAFQDQLDKVNGLATFAIEAYEQGKGLRDWAKEKGVKMEAWELVAAPQALLFYSYSHLWDNLTDVLAGRMEFGFGKDIDRIQPWNAWAAGEMGKVAWKKIAETLFGMYTDGILDNFQVLGLGEGNGSFCASVIEKFKKHNTEVTNPEGFVPKVLVTDIDPATEEPARNNFTARGLAENFNWLRVNMADPVGLEDAISKLGDETVVIHIGYILHEKRSLAINTLKALSQVLQGRRVLFAFSEYYLQEVTSPDVPEWFQVIHILTQELFTEEAFAQFLDGFNLKRIDMGDNKKYKTVHNSRADTNATINETVLCVSAS